MVGFFLTKLVFRFKINHDFYDLSVINLNTISVTIFNPNTKTIFIFSSWMHLFCDKMHSWAKFGHFLSFPLQFSFILLSLTRRRELYKKSGKVMLTTNNFYNEFLQLFCFNGCLVFGFLSYSSIYKPCIYASLFVLFLADEFVCKFHELFKSLLSKSDQLLSHEIIENSFLVYDFFLSFLHIVLINWMIVLKRRRFLVSVLFFSPILWIFYAKKNP